MLFSQCRSLAIRRLGGVDRRMMTTTMTIMAAVGSASRRCFSSSVVRDISKIRNLSIIAHVDHGKTSLVDCLLKESLSQRSGSTESERVMDSNQLEKERGITILAKATELTFNGYTFNICDTPGHADFGGEVERSLSMVDGVALVVDATEGPMAQTKFVLKKALQAGKLPMVVINKVDRPTAATRVGGPVENEIFDLFCQLDANDEQLDYPVLYASARQGWCRTDWKDESVQDVTAFFAAAVKRFPSPNVDPTAAFQMLVSQLESNSYFGKCLLGRVQSGTVKVGQRIHSIAPNGDIVEDNRIMKILKRRQGMTQIAVDEAVAGDIVSIAGLPKSTVNSTLADLSIVDPIPSIPIDPPTISMMFAVNDSPLSGKDAKSKKVTSTMIRERLEKEVESNIALNLTISPNGEAFEVRGRGELQLGILIETMRREGFEMSIYPPKCLFKDDGSEPIEEAVIDVEADYAGTVIEKLTLRKGELKDYTTHQGRSRLVFQVPTRGLMGYRREFVNDTHGSGVMQRLFLEYGPYRGSIDKLEKGALISSESGIATMYALLALEPRGQLFVSPGEEVYEGMVIGEHTRDNDLECNASKEKHLSNVRTVMRDDTVKLTPPRILTLEDAITYMRDDECLEVTPSSIRLRKQLLDSAKRKVANRKK
ncbi:mitochondrial translation GTP-binding protein TypA/BipA [Andalucia godoyi]|uniref:Mitochondrial translation GTP-binding protein TypA/BipA n=1 Tax=Andalucia godoyi TaxID=505711 RepID=A0A8K0AJB4_ANDGO|nr:mitochondrial translation GTP-binding protein TypA/BipA [Andalucia godoyi]|eukprot:ANDGO_03540.mRNA.1 mitochondrial translation GTP-binding protein TypA/BipA